MSCLGTCFASFRSASASRIGFTIVCGTIPWTRLNSSLHLPAAVGLGERVPDRVRHLVRVQDDMRVRVSCGPADRLDQGPCVAEEPLLVRIQDPDEPDLGDVEPLAEEVDPDEDVEPAEPELPDDLGPLDGIDLGVEVPGLDPALGEPLGELLGELLGERRDQRPLSLRDRLLDLLDHVEGLARDRPDLDRRVHEPRRPDDLLGDPVRDPPARTRRGWPRRRSPACRYSRNSSHFRGRLS